MKRLAKSAKKRRKGVRWPFPSSKKGGTGKKGFPSAWGQKNSFTAMVGKGGFKRTGKGSLLKRPAKPQRGQWHGQ